MTNPNRAPRYAAVLAAVALAILSPAVVSAHAELDTSTPADGATVDSPFDGPILLTFTEVLADGSEANLVEADGSPIASADVDKAGARMTINLAAALDAGDYEIRWTGVGEDGHVDRGTIGFTVAPAPPTPEPTPEPTPTPSAAPSAAPSSPPATVEPTASASPTPSNDGGETGAGEVLLPIVVALLVVGAGAVYLLTRRNRPTLPG